MRKLLGMVLVLSLLCGCSLWGGRKYVSVKPHDEGYEINIDSSAITVSSYLGLKNAILDFVSEGVEDGVIRVESYPGEITEDLEEAVYEIWRSDPLGAYAVDFMTYDCAKIVSQYEIHIHNTFRRTPEELSAIVYASNMDVARLRIKDALEDYQGTLILRVGEYQEIDLQGVVDEILLNNPDFAMESPSVTVTAYPETGTQRILELSFHYETPQETLLLNQEAMMERVDLIARLYGSNNDQVFSARRFYDRLRRDSVLVSLQDDPEPLQNSIYAALIENQATSLGYAQAYILLLREKDIPCSLVNGIYVGQTHFWCRVVLEEQVYYVDPSPVLTQLSYEDFLFTEEQLPAYGYELKQ